MLSVAAVNVALRIRWKGHRRCRGDPFNHEIFWTDGYRPFCAQMVRMPPRSNGSSQLVDLNFDASFPSAPAFTAVRLAADAEFAEATGCTVTDLRRNAWGSGATGLVAAADSEESECKVRLCLRSLRKCRQSQCHRSRSKQWYRPLP